MKEYLEKEIDQCIIALKNLELSQKRGINTAEATLKTYSAISEKLENLKITIERLNIS